MALTTQPRQRSIGLATTPDGSTQRPIVPMHPSQTYATNTTLATIATVAADYGAPDLTGATLSGATARFTWKRDPTYNSILVPMVGHATAPNNLWGTAVLFGVREWGDGDQLKYVRNYLGTIGFQGGANTISPTASANYPGFPKTATPGVAVWSFCDVGVVVEDGLPDPAISVMHQAAAGGSVVGFAMDTWGCAWIEVYTSGSVPSGQAGSAASATKFYCSEV